MISSQRIIMLVESTFQTFISSLDIIRCCENAEDRTIWPWTEKINNRWITKPAHWSFAMLISTAILMDYLSSLLGIAQNRLYWGTGKFIAYLNWVTYLALQHRIFSNLYFSSDFLFYNLPELLKDQGLLWGTLARTPTRTVRLIITQEPPEACCWSWYNAWEEVVR